MKRKVFYSFHFDNDNWRAGQVRNMGVVEGNQPVSGNKWEEIKQSEVSIKRWIDDNLKDKSCLIVLIGEKTSERKWVKYEIERAWELGKAVCGIYIDRLENSSGEQSLLKVKILYQVICLFLKRNTSQVNMLMMILKTTSLI